ncbi:hypothetical protein [Chromobacterium haemolyticum]|uniref:hypothetical protein n=1 Tax=Chromobacterium haemolyticum TaxID=394935 RepID=UPI0011B209BE|nr:hypothetical protein [Chromobacterium haemolyticum]
MQDLRKLFLSGIKLITDNNGYSADKISRFAYEFYLDFDIEDEALSDAVSFLKGMDAGPEFELSEKDFWSYIDSKKLR